MLKRSPAQRREGTVTVVVAISMIAILSIVALSLDGGMMMDKHRQAQCAADAAALAAADDLYSNWYTNSTSGLDNTLSKTVASLSPTTVTGSAHAAAKAAAAANGFADGVNGVTVTVNIAPTSGNFSGVAGHVEVYVSFSQRRFFSRLFGTSDVPIGARAVARGKRFSIKQAIITLDPTNKGSFSSGGNGTINITGAPVQVNSNNAAAMVANGGGTISAPVYYVGGTPGSSTPGGGTFTGPINPNSPPLPDPLASLPAPDPATLTQRNVNKNKLTISGNGNQTVTLLPGVYSGGISITGKNVVLSPGIYYMDGGGFSLGGGGSLTGTGVMIYNDPQSNSDTISLSGGGAVSLSPMTSGPYQGILLFQNRTATATVSVTGNGSAPLSITGTFYAAAATLNVTGNGTQDTIGAQYISYDVTLGGNGTFNVNWDPNTTPGQRQIYLVE